MKNVNVQDLSQAEIDAAIRNRKNLLTHRKSLADKANKKVEAEAKIITDEVAAKAKAIRDAKPKYVDPALANRQRMLERQGGVKVVKTVEQARADAISRHEVAKSDLTPAEARQAAVERQTPTKPASTVEEARARMQARHESAVPDKRSHAEMYANDPTPEVNIAK